MTHSLGPWVIDEQKNEYGDILVRSQDDWVVCEVNGTEPDAEANAQLIATALELLKVCREALKYVAIDVNERNADTIMCASPQELYHELKQAIAAVEEKEPG